MALASRSLVAATLAAISAAGLLSPGLRAQNPTPPQQLMIAVVKNENAASDQHDRWLYLSSERSGRTGGHLWTERVAETAPGRVRMLIAEDGKPLSPQRQQAERDRLQHIEAHPEEFIKHEQNTRAEEKRARQMLEVLPKDFLFENVTLRDGIWRMNFRPNPSYSPSGIEERVLHNMAGTLVIDARELRLIHMDFHLTQDVSIGFGLLGDIRPGTNFVSDRQTIDGHWHTLHIATQVRAKAIIFKQVDLNIELTRYDFKPLPQDLTVPQAAALLLR
jgi:hypothetical protein